MPACSGCRPPPTPGRTCFPRMSTWTSRRPRDPARMGLVCGHGRDLGYPLPADQDRRGRADTGQPGLSEDGDRCRVAAARRRRPRLAHSATFLLALGARLHHRGSVAALVSARRWRAPSCQLLLAGLTLAVVCTAVGFLLFCALIGEVGPVRATVITYFNPAVALLLGVVLLHEPFTVGAVVGFSLILAGSVLAARRTSALAGSAPVPSSTAWGAVARYRRARQRRSQG